MLNQTANDNGANINISVTAVNNNIIIYNQNYTSVESNAAQNQINKYREGLEEEEPLTKHKQVFYWASASFANINDSSDKGIIEQFDKKAHKVIFKNDIDKENMTKYNGKYNKEWQDVLYVVDVMAIKIQDVIKTYKILNVYIDDTINPDED